MKVLVKTCYNWADEADFPSWTMIEKDKFEEMKKTIVDYFDREDSWEITVGVGTNEDIEFRDAADVLGDMQVKTLTNEEADVVKRLFGDSYGECSIEHVYYAVQDAANELGELEEIEDDLEE